MTAYLPLSWDARPTADRSDHDSSASAEVKGILMFVRHVSIWRLRDDREAPQEPSFLPRKR